ncbi:hypothetical protein NKH18_27840 [Streptomyces sp. M10(2022)]
MARDACGRLGPETARLCRLTALGGWPSVDAHLAGAAAETAPAQAARMLAEAADAQLVEALPDGRYRFRPEVRRWLAETAGPEHGIPECSAAVARVLDALLNRALHAAHAALPQSWRTEPAPARELRTAMRRKASQRCRPRPGTWHGRCPWPRSTGTSTRHYDWPAPCGRFS